LELRDWRCGSGGHDVGLGVVDCARQDVQIVVQVVE